MKRHTVISVGVRVWLATSLILALCSAATAQQTTGDVLGTVTDASGAVVPGATVVIENLGTHEKRTSQTSSSGEYVVNLLKPGTYGISISASGFKTFTVPSLKLQAGDRTRVDAPLAIGRAAETVTVEAQPSALQTDSSVISSTINDTATQDLPLNGRNYIQLVQLAPGANEGPPTALTNGSELDDRRQTASVSANGQSDVLNNQMLDGADNNERLIGTIGVRPSVEAVAEMRVETSDYTAEVGRTGGAVVNVVTKSGTDVIHGSLFEFFRNDVLDAAAFQFGATLPKTMLRQNQFGGSIGGPIIKDKTFFFGDYEGYRLIQGQPPQIATVPTLYEEQHPGDFTDIGGSVIPPSAIDKAGLAYFSMLPAPNFGTNQFVAGYNERQISHAFDVRLDHSFNSANTMYARFTYNNVYTDNPGVFPKVTVDGLTFDPSFIGSGLGYARDLDYNGLLTYIHVFSTNLLLELKFGYTRANNQSYPETDGQNPNAAFGQPNVNTPISDSTGLAPIVVITGADLGSTLFQPLKDQDNTFQYLGSLAYNHGAHNIKVGAGVIRRQLTSFQSSFPEGIWVFLDYPGLLQGQYLSNGGRALQLVPPHLRLWEPSGYVQDDWRLTKRLTLNLGLRYDLFTPFTEVHNDISTFDPSTGALLVAGQNGVSDTAGIKTDYRGLVPRLGFAATVSKGLVVRGGYGISFFPMNTTSNANLKNPPFVASETACGYFNCGPGFTIFADGFPPPVAASLSTPGVSIPDAVDPNWRTSYLQSYNLTVQKDWSGNVVRVSYVGSIGRDLAQLLPDLNAPPPNTCGSNAACYNALRPYISVDPNLGSVGWFQTYGKSSYNALQTSFERRLKNGLTANVNYQWAHSLGNELGLSEENVKGGYGDVPSQVNRLDYGNGPLDVRQRLAFTGNYELPFGKASSGARRELIKGWQFNVIGVWSTGFPYTVTNASNINNTLPGSSNTDRPDMVSDPTLSHPTIQAYFNPAAFVPQAPGTIGNEARNALYGPSFRHVDLSLFKIFPLSERFNLEFRAECFNISNTPNFAAPNLSLPAPGGTPITLSNINDPTVNPTHFGQITAMNYNYAPREFQFALKLRF